MMIKTLQLLSVGALAMTGVLLGGDLSTASASPNTHPSVQWVDKATFTKEKAELASKGAAKPQEIFCTATADNPARIGNTIYADGEIECTQAPDVETSTVDLWENYGSGWLEVADTSSGETGTDVIVELPYPCETGRSAQWYTTLDVDAFYGNWAAYHSQSGTVSESCW